MYRQAHTLLYVCGPDCSCCRCPEQPPLGCISQERRPCVCKCPDHSHLDVGVRISSSTCPDRHSRSCTSFVVASDVRTNFHMATRYRNGILGVLNSSHMVGHVRTFFLVAISVWTGFLVAIHGRTSSLGPVGARTSGVWIYVCSHLPVGVQTIFFEDVDARINVFVPAGVRPGVRTSM